MDEQITTNRDKIISLLAFAETHTDLLKVMRECHILLRQTAQLIEDDEFAHSWNPRKQDISDLMPCLLCNGHYPYAAEYTRGIQYEPIAGQGKVFICWECLFDLYKKLQGHFDGMAYSFLFSLGKDVIELRKNYLKLEEERKQQHGN